MLIHLGMFRGTKTGWGDNSYQVVQAPFYVVASLVAPILAYLGVFSMLGASERPVIGRVVAAGILSGIVSVGEHVLVWFPKHHGYLGHLTDKICNLYRPIVGSQTMILPILSLSSLELEPWLSLSTSGFITAFSGSEGTSKPDGTNRFIWPFSPLVVYAARIGLHCLERTISIKRIKPLRRISDSGISLQQWLESA